MRLYKPLSQSVSLSLSLSFNLLVRRLILGLIAHGLVLIESNASNSATGGASASTNESATGGATSSVHSVVISCDWVEIRGKTSGDVRIYDFEEATTRLNSKNDAKLDKDKNRRDKSTDSIYELPVAPAPPNKGLSAAAPANKEEGAASASLPRQRPRQLQHNQKKNPELVQKKHLRDR